MERRGKNRRAHRHPFKRRCSSTPTAIAAFNIDRPTSAARETLTSNAALEAQRGHRIAALVLDQEDRAFQPLERGLGLLVAERRGPLVIGLRGAGILRAAAATFRKRAYPLECAAAFSNTRAATPNPSCKLKNLREGRRPPPGRKARIDLLIDFLGTACYLDVYQRRYKTYENTVWQS